MGTRKGSSKPKGPAALPQCTYYEASLAADASGDVIKGLGIDKQEAIDLRKNGDDVVVCGPDPRENRREASDIEHTASGVGNIILHPAHVGAGASSLNHYQAINPPPKGHCFYETNSQKAK